MLNKISLSVYVKDIVSEFNISNDELTFNKVRRKYERELRKRDLWDKAEMKNEYALNTRVFFEKDLRFITISIVDYLLKNSSKSKIKNFIDYKFLVNKYSCFFDISKNIFLDRGNEKKDRLELEKVKNQELVVEEKEKDEVEKEILKGNDVEDSKVNLVDDKNNFIDNVFENEKVYFMIKSIYKIVCKGNDNLLYNDKITLSDFVEIYVSFFSFKSEVNKNFVFAKIRRKFQQELEKKRLWDKAEIKFIGRSKIKLFSVIELYEVGLKVSDYLFKINEIDKISYDSYKKIVDEVKFKKNKINLNENIIRKDEEIYFMIKSIYKVLNNKENDNV